MNISLINHFITGLEKGESMESQSLQVELNQWGYSNATARVNTSRKSKSQESKQGGGS